jgi:ABC-2 type transport system permease protein/oleandomycin transport system permease protein
VTTRELAPDDARSDRRRDVPFGPIWLVRDSWTEARRHLTAVPRNVDILVFSAVQPIMFVLLFAYVFAGSVHVPGYPDYLQYLMPGVFAQAVLFGSSFTSIGVAEDISTGLVNRLRSLPMYLSGVLIGRTLSDFCRNIGTFAIVFVVGYLVGFRIEGSALGAVEATLLLLAFGYSFSWIQAYIGISVSSVEAANSAGFIWMFPLTFVSSAFVIPSTMPGALEWFANWNPFSKLCDATRALYNGADPGADAWISLAWAIGITVVFAFLATRKFGRAPKR